MDSGIRIYATKEQIKEFKKSVIWKDMMREMVMWKKGFDQELKSIVGESEATNPSTASVLLHMGDLNGRVKAVEYILSMPDVFIHLLEQEKENDSRHNKTD